LLRTCGGASPFPEQAYPRHRHLPNPSGTPAPVIAKLNSEYLRALHAPEVRERLEGFGFEVVGNTPEQFASRMRSESQRLARVIDESGAKLE
jgi:tripartite-type tricarboxylate transporter receptor subunit TctC